MKDLYLYLKKFLPVVIATICVGSLPIILCFYIGMRYELNDVILNIIYMVIIILFMFIECAIMTRLSKRNDGIPIGKYWNQYVDEAREYRKLNGYTSYENIPDFRENNNCALHLRRPNENTQNMVIRVQNKRDKKECFEIYANKDNIEQLRVLFNIWTILLKYYNKNTSFEGLKFGLDFIIKDSEGCPETDKIFMKRL